MNAVGNFVSKHPWMTFFLVGSAIGAIEAVAAAARPKVAVDGYGDLVRFPGLSSYGTVVNFTPKQQAEAQARVDWGTSGKSVWDSITGGGSAGSIDLSVPGLIDIRGNLNTPPPSEPTLTQKIGTFIDQNKLLVGAGVVGAVVLFKRKS